MSDSLKIEFDPDMIELMRLAYEDWIRSLTEDESWKRAVKAMAEYLLSSTEWYPGMKGRGIRVRQR
jgi:hypothetical protein